MDKPTQDQFEEALAAVSDDDKTANGAPRVDAINGMLEAMELAPIDAEERDAMFAAIGSDEDRDADPAPTTPDDTPLETAPEGSVRIHLERAMADPVPLYVHGVGSFSLRVGDDHTIPAEAADALAATDAVFTRLED